MGLRRGSSRSNRCLVPLVAIGDRSAISSAISIAAAVNREAKVLSATNNVTGQMEQEKESLLTENLSLRTLDDTRD
jgi:hypothetical protein